MTAAIKGHNVKSIITTMFLSQLLELLACYGLIVFNFSIYFYHAMLCSHSMSCHHVSDCLFIHPSVTSCGVLSRWLNLRSCKQCPETCFLTPKILAELQLQCGCQIQVGKDKCQFSPQQDFSLTGWHFPDTVKCSFISFFFQTSRHPVIMAPFNKSQVIPISLSL